MYILQLLDTYAASWAVFVMAILECIIIAWLYGRYCMLLLCFFFIAEYINLLSLFDIICYMIANYINP